MKGLKNIIGVFFVIMGLNFSAFGDEKPLITGQEKPVKHLFSVVDKLHLAYIDPKIKLAIGGSIYSKRKWKKFIDNNQPAQELLLKHLYSNNVYMQSAVVKALKFAKLHKTTQSELLLLLAVVREKNTAEELYIGEQSPKPSVPEITLVKQVPQVRLKTAQEAGPPAGPPPPMDHQTTLVEQILTAHAPHLHIDVQKSLFSMLLPSFPVTDPAGLSPVQSAARRIIMESARGLLPEKQKEFIGMIFTYIYQKALNKISGSKTSSSIHSAVEALEIKEIERILMAMTGRLSSNAQRMLINQLFFDIFDYALSIKIQNMIKRVLLQIPNPHQSAQSLLKKLIVQANFPISPENEAFINEFLSKTPSSPELYLQVKSRVQQGLSSIIGRCQKVFR